MMSLIPKNTKKYLYVILIIISHLSFSYWYFKGWWYSSVGTLIIILLSSRIWHKDFLPNIGLGIKTREIYVSVVLAAILLILSFYISDYLATKSGIQIYFSGWQNYYHDIFYTLNEEIILGAMLLFFSIKKFKLHPLVISAIIAVLFSVIHFIFYKWIFVEQGVIQPLTLTTLFIVGFLRNNLIIHFGHIGYSWALHFGWMAVMFGNDHHYKYSGEQLSEPERFNIYIGSYEVLFISSALAVLSIYLYQRKSVNIKNISNN